MHFTSLDKLFWLDVGNTSLSLSTYFAIWMSGPLAYLCIPQTLAPSHEAQVSIDVDDQGPQWCLEKQRGWKALYSL